MPFWKRRDKEQNQRRRKSLGRTPLNHRATFEPLESRQMLSVSGDFNGDGISDLAIGSPGLKWGTAAGAGGVSVIYGKNGTGLTTAGNQVWSMSRPGMVGGTQAKDAFGSALAVGDFNDDGFDDLAISLPGRNAIVPVGTFGSTTQIIGGVKVGVLSNVGAVSIIYGSQFGLVANHSQIFTQKDLFPLTTLVAGTQFGYALTTGDFDGDGFADLAIGAPGMTVDGLTKAGAVYTISGSSLGLDSSVAQVITQNTVGILGDASKNAAFGQSLTTGDFDLDGYSNLVVGAPSYPIKGGSVNVINGSAGGLTPVGGQIWFAGNGGLKGTAIPGTLFGFSLAVGDFNGDFIPDLAIGSPGARIGAGAVGAVNIIYGTLFSGLSSLNNQFITRTSLGSTSTNGDQFGYSLSAGYYNGDNFSDLAIGTPTASVNNVKGAGLVQIVYGASTGLTSTGTFALTEATPKAGYNYGASITSGDYNGDGFIDISVGIPHEAFGTLLNVGAVQTDYGSATGIWRKNQQLWRYGLLGLQGTATAGSGFGSALS